MRLECHTLDTDDDHGNASILLYIHGSVVEVFRVSKSSASRARRPVRTSEAMFSLRNSTCKKENVGHWKEKTGRPV